MMHERGVVNDAPTVLVTNESLSPLILRAYQSAFDVLTPEEKALLTHPWIKRAQTDLALGVTISPAETNWPELSWKRIVAALYDAKIHLPNGEKHWLAGYTVNPLTNDVWILYAPEALAVLPHLQHEKATGLAGHQV